VRWKSFSSHDENDVAGRILEKRAEVLKREKTLLVLKPQVAAAESAVQKAVAAGESADNIKHLEARAAEAKAKLEKAEAEAQHAEAALVSAAHGDASVKPGEDPPAQAGLARDFELNACAA
jgi:hypothetical protein